MRLSDPFFLPFSPPIPPQSGALACWDYATGAAALPIDMNPVRLLPASEGGGANPLIYKDAIFLSPHKLPGGPGAPGVLVAKRLLFRNAVPSEPGGGTVFFVTDEQHRYLSKREDREEGGTQDLLGAVRVGLTMQVRSRVGDAGVEAAEAAVAARLFSAVQGCAGLCPLGPPLEASAAAVSGEPSAALGRLPILSFLVRAPQAFAQAQAQAARYLHHNFVCALLNDVFGVQARGGCMCAGPYALRLLGVSRADAAAVEGELLAKEGWSEALRPGFARVSLPYFAAAEEVAFVAAAVRLVAESGWRLLPDYRFNPKTGEWKVRRLGIVRSCCSTGRLLGRAGCSDWPQVFLFSRHPIAVRAECSRAHTNCLSAPPRPAAHVAPLPLPRAEMARPPPLAQRAVSGGAWRAPDGGGGGGVCRRHAADARAGGGLLCIALAVSGGGAWGCPPRCVHRHRLLGRIYDNLV